MPKPSKGVQVFLRNFLEAKVFEIRYMNVLDYNFTGGAAKKFLRSLKRYDFSKIARKESSLSAGFGSRIPQYFITNYRGTDILIDTQGYDYPRYTTIITHYPS